MIPAHSCDIGDTCAKWGVADALAGFGYHHQRCSGRVANSRPPKPLTPSKSMRLNDKLHSRHHRVNIFYNGERQVSILFSLAPSVLRRQQG